MWQTVKSENLKTGGKNIWMYEADEKVFVGLELLETSKNEFILEKKEIQLTKYAYYKHFGAYEKIPVSGERMKTELQQKGFKTCSPYIEIYGHWNADETQLETELLMSLK